MTVKLVYQTDDGKIWNNHDDAENHSDLLDNIRTVSHYINDTIHSPAFSKFHPVLLNHPSALKEMAELLIMSDVAAFAQAVLARSKTPVLSAVPKLETR